MRLLRLFNNPAYARMNRIKTKQATRRKNIDAAYEYLNNWSDIPISQLFPSICHILHIKKNKAAFNLVLQMNMDLEPSDLEKLIPLY